MDLQAERRNRLQYLHGALIDLLMNEGHLITERTNNFLILNSILFAANILLVIENNNTLICLILKIVLPILGILTCYFHILTISLAFEVAIFWRTSIGLIETDEDFWYPSRTEMDEDLDIMIAKTKYMDYKYDNSKIKTRQAVAENKLYLSHSKPWDIVSNLPFKVSSNKLFEYWVPFLLIFLWLITLLIYGPACLHVIINLIFI
jgi:hypothetical protein